jgi:competence protein ComEA
VVASSGLTPDGKVILNRAGLADLMRLPGVGPKRAEAILALRERLGSFRRPTDLLRVRGIGPATLQKMQPHFVLDPPPPSPPSAP